MMNKIYKKLLLLAIVTIWWLWIFGDVSTAFAATSIDPTINQTLPLSAPLVTCSTWADMSNVLLAGVCFKSESGSSTTTLLVKEGKVAINSDDIDRIGSEWWAITYSCEEGYAFSWSINKCVKTTCSWGTPTQCGVVSSWYMTTYPEQILNYENSHHYYYDSYSWWNENFTLNTQEKLDIYNQYYGEALTLWTNVSWSEYRNALIKNREPNQIRWCGTDTWCDPKQEDMCYFFQSESTSSFTSYTYSSYEKIGDSIWNCVDWTIIDPYLNAPVDPHRTISIYNDIWTKINPASTCSDFSCGKTTCDIFYTDNINPCSYNPSGKTLRCNYTKNSHSTSSIDHYSIHACCPTNNTSTCTTDIKDPIVNTVPWSEPSVLLVNWIARGTSILNYSDIKLKTNIQKIDSALEKVTKLNGYRFTWKDSGQPDFGVLAQEVEKVFADAVSTDDTGMKAVAYGQLLAPIIESIKEINTTVDAMTIKAQQQAERISALENR